jgi:hypothetical protein
MVIRCENVVHNANCAAAELARQVAVSAAMGVRASINLAEITFYRAVVRSALSNGCEASAAMGALRALGVTGQ